MITGIAHPGCTVSDLERSLRFYGETLGIERAQSQVSDQPYLALVTGVPGCRLKIGFVRVDGDSRPFELIEYIAPRSGRAATGFGIVGTFHLCWQVSNLDAVYNRLERQGVAFCAEPQQLVDGPWGEARGVFLADPDGSLVELIESPGDQGGGGRLVRIHHVGLMVSNRARALDFLCDRLGLNEASRYECDSVYIRHNAGLADNTIRAATVLMPATQVCIELWEFRAPVGAPADVARHNVGSGHVCFLVDDIVATHAALSGRGVRFVGPPAEVTAGVNRGARAIYLLGPDNIRFELFQKPRNAT
jgi:lactoylglutathione lyase